MNPRVSIVDLFDDLCEQLKLTWGLLENQPSPHGTALIQGACSLNTAQIHHLQIIDPESQTALSEDANAGQTLLLDQLRASKPAALLLSDNSLADTVLARWANDHGIPLCCSPLPATNLIQYLQDYLQRTEQNPITLHGVFMNIMELGVLIRGEAAIGKSELALALVSRGHQLIADDAVELAEQKLNQITGRSPTVLQDFLTVRGLGVMNIRAMFGDHAICQEKQLSLVITLKERDNMALNKLDPLAGNHSQTRILNTQISHITLPANPGRHLELLVEACVQNYRLHCHGYDANQDLAERQRSLLAASHSK